METFFKFQGQQSVKSDYLGIVLEKVWKRCWMLCGNHLELNWNYYGSSLELALRQNIR